MHVSRRRIQRYKAKNEAGQTWGQQDNKPQLWSMDGLSFASASTRSQTTALNRVWSSTGGQDASQIWSALEAANLVAS
jgi:hypothetical protein